MDESDDDDDKIEKISSENFPSCCMMFVVVNNYLLSIISGMMESLLTKCAFKCGKFMIISTSSPSEIPIKRKLQ